MSSSLTPEQVAEQAMSEKAELEAQVKYLQTQLGQLLKERRRWRQGSSSRRNQEEPVGGREEETQQSYSSSDDGEIPLAKKGSSP